jgi:hypothetical protein
MLAHRVIRRPEFARHSLIDYSYGPSALVVALFERSPAFERDAHRFEVTGENLPVINMTFGALVGRQRLV